PIYGGREEADDEAAPSEEQEGDGPERPRADPVVAVEPAELGIAREVADAVHVGRLEAVREEPPDVAPPESLRGRVDVAVGVGVAVVVAVVGGPPQRALLGSGGAAERHEELRDA